MTSTRPEAGQLVATGPRLVVKERSRRGPARRMLGPVRTLAEYPQLVAEIDRRNGEVVPGEIAHASRRALWWRCPAGPDHVWRTAVVARARKGRGCPFCAGKAVSMTNALSTVAPEVAWEWHPTKNGSLRPGGVVAGSHVRVWWKCPRGAAHEWQAEVGSRARGGKGCPYCAGVRVSPETSLEAHDPALAKEWHPTKNGRLGPGDVTPMSIRRVWWQCPASRDHVWENEVSRRRSRGCPFCSGHRICKTNALSRVAPALAKEWHPTKNGDLRPGDVTWGSSRRVWWKCPEGSDHEWEAVVANRRAGHRCPFCMNRRVSVTNSLSAVAPGVAAEWHPTKNGKLTPHDVTYGSHRRVWWRCASGHVWDVTVHARTTGGTDCPQCYRIRSRGPRGPRDRNG